MAAKMEAKMSDIIRCCRSPAAALVLGAELAARSRTSICMAGSVVARVDRVDELNTDYLNKGLPLILHGCTARIFAVSNVDLKHTIASSPITETSLCGTFCQRARPAIPGMAQASGQLSAKRHTCIQCILCQTHVSCLCSPGAMRPRMCICCPRACCAGQNTGHHGLLKHPAVICTITSVTTTTELEGDSVP